MNLVAALIVKNEGEVLQRCLTSLEPHCRVIVVNDNGSTDNTPEILDACRKTIQVPGPWVNFAVNRNLVFNVARQWGDYVLCHIDADEELVVDPGFRWPSSGPDAFELELHLQGTVYPRIAIVSSMYPWEWRYPVHEGLYPLAGAQAPRIERLSGVRIVSHRDGARSKDPETAGRDLVTLLDAIANDPKNPRLTFYIAQMYKDLRNYEAAAQWYLRRTELEGYPEEVWYSHYMLARIKDWEGGDPVPLYMNAFERNPLRAEPLFYAADWCRRQKHFNQALMFGSAARVIVSPPPGAIFVERSVYDWQVLDLIHMVAYYTPYPQAGGAVFTDLLGQAPQSELPRIVNNASFYARM